MTRLIVNIVTSDLRQCMPATKSSEPRLQSDPNAEFDFLRRLSQELRHLTSVWQESHIESIESSTFDAEHCVFHFFPVTGKAHVMFFIFFDSSVQNVLLCFGPILCVVQVCSMQNRILTQLSHAQSRIQNENVLMAHRTTPQPVCLQQAQRSFLWFGAHTQWPYLFKFSLCVKLSYIYIYTHTLKGCPCRRPRKQ